MLKKTTSFVLASLRTSTYGNEYASALRLLRPCWMAFLNILSRAMFKVIGQRPVNGRSERRRAFL